MSAAKTLLKMSANELQDEMERLTMERSHIKKQIAAFKANPNNSTMVIAFHEARLGAVNDEMDLVYELYQLAR